MRSTFAGLAMLACLLAAGCQGKSGKEVAGVLGLTTAAVYLAKRRVTQRLKQQIDHLRAE